MANPYTVIVEGLDALGDFSKLDQQVMVAARRGVNRGAAWALPEASRRIRHDISFTASYVKSKLALVKQANGNSLEAIIRGQRRATSLARFIQGSKTVGGASRRTGVTIMVRPGRTLHLKGAFLIKLRAGGATTDTVFNLGLAIRLPPGQSPKKSQAAKALGKGTWLLYGPSVQQAFINNEGGGEAKDMTVEIQNVVEDEFNRQLDLAGVKR